MLAARGEETHLKKEESRCIYMRLNVGTSMLDCHKSILARSPHFLTGGNLIREAARLSFGRGQPTALRQASAGGPAMRVWGTASVVLLSWSCSGLQA
jgi:hypothetical protein